jgi:hypothetical protein
MKRAHIEQHKRTWQLEWMRSSSQHAVRRDQPAAKTEFPGKRKPSSNKVVSRASMQDSTAMRERLFRTTTVKGGVWEHHSLEVAPSANDGRLTPQFH